VCLHFQLYGSFQTSKWRLWIQWTRSLRQRATWLLLTLTSSGVRECCAGINYKDRRPIHGRWSCRYNMPRNLIIAEPDAPPPERRRWHPTPRLKTTPLRLTQPTRTVRPFKKGPSRCAHITYITNYFRKTEFLTTHKSEKNPEKFREKGDQTDMGALLSTFYLKYCFIFYFVSFFLFYSIFNPHIIFIRPTYI